jgi:hypothetical protein
MFNDVNMKNNKILISYLETISGIADREYQERVWIRGEGPECDDYTESICHFFDDGDPIISNYEGYEITKRQLDSLVKLREAVQDFNSSVRFELGPDFLYSAEWINITLMAQHVLQVFGYQQAKNVKNKAE